MSQDLIDKFENMSDRELLIAVCIKTDHIEDRMNKHSGERALEQDRNREDKNAIHFKLDTITEMHTDHDKRISHLEAERTFFGKFATPLVSVIGGGISGWLSKHF